MPSTPTPPMAYFITMATFASWFHGDGRGSADRGRIQSEEEMLQPNPLLEKYEQGITSSKSTALDDAMRGIVLAALKEVAAFRGWKLWAVHVRTQHVHLVISSTATVEKVMADCKARATRLLREAQRVEADQKVWARHGSTKYLWEQQDVEDAAWYVLFEQGDPLAVFDGRQEPSGQT